MNDGDFLFNVFIYVLIALGFFSLGTVVGKYEFYDKPCDQFQQWQYDQKLVRQECVK